MNKVRDERTDGKEATPVADATALEQRVAMHGAAGQRAAALVALVERTLAGLGYELVELERAGGGLLRITLDIAPEPADRVDVGEDAQRHVGIEDCERVSRHLTHLFAVEDVEYGRLEVSSPGMDRPLRGARDFARFAGSMAKVQVFSPAEGRRRLRGRLLGLVPPLALGQEAGAGAQRVRMALVPEAPPPGTRAPKGARGPRARKAGAEETVEFALAEVEKARLAPDWEFDRSAIARSAPSRTE